MIEGNYEWKQLFGERNKPKDKEEIKSFITWVMDLEEYTGILDRILEWLNDSGYLNKKGKAFTFKFWKEFVWDGEDEVAEEYYHKDKLGEIK